jgi:hypothetical protein
VFVSLAFCLFYLKTIAQQDNTVSQTCRYPDKSTRNIVLLVFKFSRNHDLKSNGRGI